MATLILKVATQLWQKEGEPTSRYFMHFFEIKYHALAEKIKTEVIKKIQTDFLEREFPFLI